MTVKSMKKEGEVSTQKYSLIIIIIIICFEPEVTLNIIIRLGRHAAVLLFSNNSLLTLTFKVCNEF